MPWYRLFGGMLPVNSRISKETEPAQRRFRGRVWWSACGAGGDGAGAGGKVQAPGTDGAGRGKADKGRGRSRGKARRPVAGLSRPRQNGVSLGRNAGSLGMESGGHSVALPCASAKRSCLLPEVFDDYSYAGCKLSPRDRAIIRELSDTVFCFKNFLETGGTGRSESCEKVGLLHVVC